MVQNQVPSTSTDKGNKTDGQCKPNKTIHGTALDQNNWNALAADIDLVVYGVTRNINSIQVSKWVEDQGIKVSDCVLLTKYEQARTLSFKVTISASNYEKSQDPSMWPYRVHVRPYRNYIRKRQAMIQTKDQRTDQISMRNTRKTLGTRNYTSANQSMNRNGNQFNFD